MNETKKLEERMDDMETKINVIMSLVNHINQTMSNNVINEIEDVINQAVDKKLNYINQIGLFDISNEDGTYTK